MYLFKILQKMGLGPWYRIGLSLTNAIILVAILETIITGNVAAHSIAYLYTRYYYHHAEDVDEHKEIHLFQDIKLHLHWTIYAGVIITQIFANFFLIFAVILKGNNRFASLWVTSFILKTTYTAAVVTFTTWSENYTKLEALQKIASLMWGTLLFGFCLITGVQLAYHLSNEDGRVRLSPVGCGLYALKEFYREQLPQLSSVLLLSEIITIIHRMLNYAVPPFLQETGDLYEVSQPDGLFNENVWGECLLWDELNSFATLAANCFGLITLLKIKLIWAQKLWVAVYVIIFIVQCLFLVNIWVSWPSETHSDMFKGTVFVLLLHLAYKVVVLMAYRWSIKGGNTATGRSSRRSSSSRNASIKGQCSREPSQYMDGTSREGSRVREVRDKGSQVEVNDL